MTLWRDRVASTLRYAGELHDSSDQGAEVVLLLTVLNGSTAGCEIELFDDDVIAFDGRSARLLFVGSDHRPAACTGVLRGDAQRWIITPGSDDPAGADKAFADHGPRLNDEPIQHATPLRQGDRLRFGELEYVATLLATPAPHERPGPRPTGAAPLITPAGPTGMWLNDAIDRLDALARQRATLRERLDAVAPGGPDNPETGPEWRAIVRRLAGQRDRAATMLTALRRTMDAAPDSAGPVCDAFREQLADQARRADGLLARLDRAHTPESARQVSQLMEALRARAGVKRSSRAQAAARREHDDRNRLRQIVPESATDGAPHGATRVPPDSDAAADSLLGQLLDQAHTRRDQRHQVIDAIEAAMRSAASPVKPILEQFADQLDMESARIERFIDDVHRVLDGDQASIDPLLREAIGRLEARTDEAARYARRVSDLVTGDGGEVRQLLRTLADRLALRGRGEFDDVVDGLRGVLASNRRDPQALWREAISVLRGGRSVTPSAADAASSGDAGRQDAGKAATTRAPAPTDQAVTRLVALGDDLTQSQARTQAMLTELAQAVGEQQAVAQALQATVGGTAGLPMDQALKRIVTYLKANDHRYARLVDAMRQTYAAATTRDPTLDRLADFLDRLDAGHALPDASQPDDSGERIPHARRLQVGPLPAQPPAPRGLRSGRWFALAAALLLAGGVTFLGWATWSDSDLALTVRTSVFNAASRWRPPTEDGPGIAELADRLRDQERRQAAFQASLRDALGVQADQTAPALEQLAARLEEHMTQQARTLADLQREARAANQASPLLERLARQAAEQAEENRLLLQALQDRSPAEPRHAAGTTIAPAPTATTRTDQAAHPGFIVDEQLGFLLPVPPDLLAPEEVEDKAAPAASSSPAIPAPEASPPPPATSQAAEPNVRPGAPDPTDTSVVVRSARSLAEDGEPATRLQRAYRFAFDTGMRVIIAGSEQPDGASTPTRTIDPAKAHELGFKRWQDWYLFDHESERVALQEKAERWSERPLDILEGIQFPPRDQRRATGQP